MGENFFWSVFENTGSIESYLAYKSSLNGGENKNECQNAGTDCKDDKAK